MFWKVYLFAYFAILAAALLALWQGRVLGRLPAGWVVLVVIAAVALGVLLGFVSRNRPPNPA
jgi:UDP-N-acetylmuramyl pentapeptide phosphotransferase/UDP-N-acetylglucosamine-1-phosphate transferase